MMAAVTTTTAAQAGMPWSTLPGPAHFEPAYHAHHLSNRIQHQQPYHHQTSTATMPTYHHLDARVSSFDPTSTAVAAAAAATTSNRSSYDPYPPPHPPSSSSRDAFDEGLYTSSHLVPSTKKRTRAKMYPSEEARQAAKLIQKARRREQNRNAQRRLRDRKEEHIFKLEGEVAQLRRQSEAQRAETQNLEEIIRRLLDQHQEMQRKLDSLGFPASQNEIINNNNDEWPRLAPLVSPTASLHSSPSSTRPQQQQQRKETLSNGNNALGLVEYDPAGYTSGSSARSSSTSSTSSTSADAELKDGGGLSSASSASIGTPRSPSFLSPTERSRPILSYPNANANMLPRVASPKAILPRIKFDHPNLNHHHHHHHQLTPSLLTPSTTFAGWNMHQ